MNPDKEYSQVAMVFLFDGVGFDGWGLSSQDVCRHDDADAGCSRIKPMKQNL